MGEPPVDVAETFLTERQAQVLELREAGHTQATIAGRLGTSVANISAIERSARSNVAAARRTLDLAALLGARARFTAPAGTDLRTVVDRVFEAADAVDVRVPRSDPELTARLADRLADRLDGRQLTASVEVGVRADGEVVTFPALEDAAADDGPGEGPAAGGASDGDGGDDGDEDGEAGGGDGGGG